MSQRMRQLALFACQSELCRYCRTAVPSGPTRCPKCGQLTGGAHGAGLLQRSAVRNLTTKELRALAVDRGIDGAQIMSRSGLLHCLCGKWSALSIFAIPAVATWRFVMSIFSHPGGKQADKTAPEQQLPAVKLASSHTTPVSSPQPSNSTTVSAALIEETVIEEVVVARRTSRRVLAVVKKHD